MNPKKLLVATDIPYWRNSTGAEARIHSLCRFLKSSLEVEVFFLGTLNDDDRVCIDHFENIDIRQVSSDQLPEELLNRLKWYAAATVNQARQWMTSDQTPNEETRLATLDDFRWDWAIQRFREVVNRFQPDFVLIEYVKLAYLLDAIPESSRGKTRCLVDTHDVLSSRAAQFAERGYPHWISIDEPSEVAALQTFDLIMAIQPVEAKWFAERLPKNETLVVGHSFGSVDVKKDRVRKSMTDEFVVGYLGSDNDSNLDAIRKFILEAWPVVTEKAGECVLKVCGSICHSLAASRDSFPESIRFEPTVSSLQDFYESIDVVINPVEFGTGLKIKNCEALFFGLPLITTPSGFEGMPACMKGAVAVSESVREIGQKIVQLSQNRELLGQMQADGLKLAHSEFSDEGAYSELRAWIQRQK